MKVNSLSSLIDQLSCPFQNAYRLEEDIRRSQPLKYTLEFLKNSESLPIFVGLLEDLSSVLGIVSVS